MTKGSFLMKKHKLMLASLAVLGAGFLATSSNVQAAEQYRIYSSK